MEFTGETKDLSDPVWEIQPNLKVRFGPAFGFNGLGGALGSTLLGNDGPSGSRAQISPPFSLNV